MYTQPTWTTISQQNQMPTQHSPREKDNTVPWKLYQVLGLFKNSSAGQQHSDGYCTAEADGHDAPLEEPLNMKLGSDRLIRGQSRDKSISSETPKNDGNRVFGDTSK
ncbi:hypothetical protein CY34DRAFT_109713 [Suillus luteus UH-Slu-Lm8-n1]|uniref:Uncharacterized protein n=1 Tax=Suillus luteus UH-Slu-Lm8-n1 TaxID=930992 RepID=A0A0D0ACZ5_9AGAM|nr:hypothetical protein CY34DRAFT_109713 [Suillus luteus UH-Slu-Lm8-n1]